MPKQPKKALLWAMAHNTLGVGLQAARDNEVLIAASTKVALGGLKRSDGRVDRKEARKYALAFHVKDQSPNKRSRATTFNGKRTNKRASDAP